jgi:DNA-binding NarL/FixJ family response regulator
LRVRPKGSASSPIAAGPPQSRSRMRGRVRSERAKNVRPGRDPLPSRFLQRGGAAPDLGGGGRRAEDGSGLTLLDRVRAADGLASRIDPDLPVIVLSGRAGDADRVRSFARGADDHLNKPTCRFPQHGIPLVERATVRRLRRQRENGAARGTNAWASECRAAAQRPHPEHRDPPSLRARGVDPC